ncbi:MAG TPA: DoxX family protein [Acidimicrobiales bacterium]|nr:DoxX family protein [Acidimicrobiales bacterium]
MTVVDAWIRWAGRIYGWSDKAKGAPVTRDLALLGARVALAWIFIYHGTATLFGAFGGPGLHRASIFYGTVAHLHPATFFTVLGGIIECFGGAAVGLGTFARLAAASLTGDMAMAMLTVTFSNGIASNLPGGGYELNLALATLAFVVAMLGTGKFSLDTAVRATWERRLASRRLVASERSAIGSDEGYDNRPDRLATS